MAPRVFVSGSINTDLVIYVERLPQPGETVSGGSFASFPGGKGANQAVAAARAGAEVHLHGCLGDDSFGRERMASLAATGVRAEGVRLLPGVASGIAVIAVDAKGENTIAVAPGANRHFSAEGVSFPRPAPGEVIVSLFQNEVPQETTETLVARAHEAGHFVAWNLAPTLSRVPSREVLAQVDLLVCNRNELAALVGKSLAEDTGERDAAAALALGARALLVTLGSRGSFLAEKAGITRVPAFPVKAVDTVGAGDCYCGVLASALAAGLAPRDAMRRASAAAALSTTRKGAQTSMPTAAEIDEFLSRAG